MSECNSVRHARIELQLLEDEAAKDSDASALEMQKLVTADVLKIVQAISETNQSGGSIGYILNLVRKCALQQNLSALTGEESEWYEHDPDTIQNKRMGSVFKRKDGTAYDLDGYVGVDPDGFTYTGGSLPLCPVVFPYMQGPRKFLPRFSLLTQEDGEPAPEKHVEDFLFNSVKEVLEFYERNGIVHVPQQVQTPEAGAEGAPVLQVTPS